MTATRYAISAGMSVSHKIMLLRQKNVPAGFPKFSYGEKHFP